MVYIGLDLGRKNDYSAIAVVQRSGEEFWVRYLERIALGTPYPKVVERVAQVVARLKSCAVVVDATGVGEPVVDLLRRARLGCEISAVTITGGQKESFTASNYCVPKVDLMTGVLLAMERGELRVARGLREAGALAREMLNVKVMAGRTEGRVRIGVYRDGEHDDLVMALALACWRARRRKNHLLPVG